MLPFVFDIDTIAESYTQLHDFLINHSYLQNYERRFRFYEVQGGSAFFCNCLCDKTFIHLRSPKKFQHNRLDLSNAENLIYNDPLTGHCTRCHKSISIDFWQVYSEVPERWRPALLAIFETVGKNSRHHLFFSEVMKAGRTPDWRSLTVEFYMYLGKALDESGQQLAETILFQCFWANLMKVFFKQEDMNSPLVREKLRRLLLNESFAQSELLTWAFDKTLENWDNLHYNLRQKYQTERA